MGNKQTKEKKSFPAQQTEAKSADLNPEPVNEKIVAPKNSVMYDEMVILDYGQYYGQYAFHLLNFKP